MHAGSKCLVSLVALSTETQKHRTMAVRLFEGKNHAAAYLQYRVTPQELVSKVMNFMKERVSAFVHICKKFKLFILCCLYVANSQSANSTVYLGAL